MTPNRKKIVQKTNLFEEVNEPLALVDSRARLLWANQAFNQLGALPECVLEPESASRIARTVESRRMSLNFLSNNGVQTLLTRVVRLGEGVTGPDLILLAVTLGDDHVDNFDAARLLSTIAHDLKNPIAALFGYADALLDTSLGNGLNSDQRDFLERSRRAAARASEMVRNYQVLASVNDSIDVIARGSSYLNLVVKQVLDYTWRDNPLAPHLKVDYCQLDICVCIDRIALERIIANLFSNALKFTADDGTIEICTSVEQNFGVVSVFNSCEAPSQTELDTLFERYRRGSNTRGVAGSGLGLFIVKQLVDACGGYVRAYREPLGVKFEVKLPLAAAHN